MVCNHWLLRVGSCVLSDKELVNFGLGMCGRYGGVVMWHGAWCGKSPVDARWRLRRQASFNGSKVSF